MISKFTKMFLFLLASILLSYTVQVASVSAAGPIAVEVNGRPVSFSRQPVVMGGTVMVPMRGIFEALSAKVFWDPVEKLISVSAPGANGVSLRVGSDKAVVGSELVRLPRPACLVDGSTMVPLRFVGESLGADVSWDPVARLVRVNGGPRPAPQELPAPTPVVRDNPFTMEKLRAVVESTPVDPAVAEFRARVTPRESGKDSIATKYFDIFYPRGNAVARSYAEEIAKYADTLYAFLVEVYGRQVPMDLFIDEPPHGDKFISGKHSQEEVAAYVFITEEHTRHPGSAVTTAIHEFHHGFFSTVNNDLDKEDDPLNFFVDEGVARMIAGIYTEDAFKDKEPGVYWDNWTLGFESYARHYSHENVVWPSWEESARVLRGNNWGSRDPAVRDCRDTVVLAWIYLYEAYGHEKFCELLRTAGGDGYEEDIERVYGKGLAELEGEFRDAIGKGFKIAVAPRSE